MIYSVELTKKVKKFLIKHEDIAKSFYWKMNFLRNTKLKNNLDIKILKGKKDHFRLRIGKYRFLYRIVENKVVIYFYDADSRGSVYK